MSNYEDYSHTHCHDQVDPPCGLKGKHRCCLCMHPIPVQHVGDAFEMEAQRDEGWRFYLDFLGLIAFAALLIGIIVGGIGAAAYITFVTLVH